MNTKANETNNLDEINVMEVFSLIWHRKAIVLLSIIFAIFLQIIFTMLQPDSYRASVNVKFANDADLSKINQIVYSIVPLDLHSRHPIGDLVNLSDIKDDFIFEFLDYEEVVNEIKNTEKIKGNNDEIDLIIRKIARGYKVKRYKENSFGVTKVLISFDFENLEDSLQILKNTMKEINQNMGSNYLAKFESEKRRVKFDAKIKLESKRRTLSEYKKLFSSKTGEKASLMDGSYSLKHYIDETVQSTDWELIARENEVSKKINELSLDKDFEFVSLSLDTMSITNNNRRALSFAFFLMISFLGGVSYILLTRKR